jgi:hypothetical protein
MMANYRISLRGGNMAIVMARNKKEAKHHAWAQFGYKSVVAVGPATSADLADYEPMSGEIAVADYIDGHLYAIRLLRNVRQYINASSPGGQQALDQINEFLEDG